MYYGGTEYAQVLPLRGRCHEKEIVGPRMHHYGECDRAHPWITDGLFRLNYPPRLWKLKTCFWCFSMLDTSRAIYVSDMDHGQSQMCFSRASVRPSSSPKHRRTMLHCNKLIRSPCRPMVPLPEATIGFLRHSESTPSLFLAK